MKKAAISMVLASLALAGCGSSSSSSSSSASVSNAANMYRLDANFRSAVTLGAVGGGGIGFLIDNELNVFQFRVVCTYMIVLVVFVLAIERASTILRTRLGRQWSQ
jgi:F0F1-type ATP synthase assembly protein I